MSIAYLHQFDKDLRNMMSSKAFKEADYSRRLELSYWLIASFDNRTKGRFIKCRKIMFVVNRMINRIRQNKLLNRIRNDHG